MGGSTTTSSTGTHSLRCSPGATTTAKPGIACSASGSGPRLRSVRWACWPRTGALASALAKLARPRSLGAVFARRFEAFSARHRNAAEAAGAHALVAGYRRLEREALAFWHLTLYNDFCALKHLQWLNALARRFGLEDAVPALLGGHDQPRKRGAPALPDRARRLSCAATAPANALFRTHDDAGVWAALRGEPSYRPPARSLRPPPRGLRRPRHRRAEAGDADLPRGARATGGARAGLARARRPRTDGAPTSARRAAEARVRAILRRPGAPRPLSFPRRPCPPLPSPTRVHAPRSDPPLRPRAPDLPAPGRRPRGRGEARGGGPTSSICRSTRSRTSSREPWSRATSGASSGCDARTTRASRNTSRRPGWRRAAFPVVTRAMAPVETRSGPCVLRGIPSAPGRVGRSRGPRRRPARRRACRRARILVTKTTDPGWIFLMAAASGLVAERGSPLSHTAIIGRELGIPTVVGVEGATTRIPDGAEIVVDGSTGEVYAPRPERGPDAPERPPVRGSWFFARPERRRASLRSPPGARRRESVATVNPDLRDRDGTPVGRSASSRRKTRAPASRSSRRPSIGSAITASVARGVRLNRDIWHGYRLMTRGFDRPPFAGEPRNPATYPAIFEQAGFHVRRRWNTFELGRDALDDLLARFEGAVLPAGYRVLAFADRPNLAAVETLHKRFSPPFRPSSASRPSVRSSSAAWSREGARPSIQAPRSSSTTTPKPWPRFSWSSAIPRRAPCSCTSGASRRRRRRRRAGSCARPSARPCGASGHEGAKSVLATLVARGNPVRRLYGPYASRRSPRVRALRAGALSGSDHATTTARRGSSRTERVYAGPLLDWLYNSRSGGSSLTLVADGPLFSQAWGLLAAPASESPPDPAVRRSHGRRPRGSAASRRGLPELRRLLHAGDRPSAPPFPGRCSRVRRSRGRQGARVLARGPAGHLPGEAQGRSDWPGSWATTVLRRGVSRRVGRDQPAGPRRLPPRAFPGLRGFRARPGASSVATTRAGPTRAATSSPTSPRTRAW